MSADCLAIGGCVRDPEVNAEVRRRPTRGQRLSQVATIIGAIGTGIHGTDQIVPVVLDLLQLPTPVIIALASDPATDDAEVL